MKHDVQSQCLACAHLDRDASEPTCSAFEEGIPAEIWTNKHDHHKPYPGDNGIRFELKVMEKSSKKKEHAS